MAKFKGGSWNSLSIREQTHGWKKKQNRKCMSNKSLCSALKDGFGAPRAFILLPSPAPPFPKSLHVTWHSNLEVVLVIKFTRRHRNQVIWMLSSSSSTCFGHSWSHHGASGWMALIRLLLHVVQRDVSKFPSLPLINVSSMLGAELHKHPHTC